MQGLRSARRVRAAAALADQLRDGPESGGDSGVASSRGVEALTVKIFSTVPGRYVITTTRSGDTSDSSMPCVTKTMVCWSSVQIRSNSSCIERLVSASSAPKARPSAASGPSRARQRASATRWRIPRTGLGEPISEPRRASLSSSASPWRALPGRRGMRNRRRRSRGRSSKETARIPGTPRALRLRPTTRLRRRDLARSRLRETLAMGVQQGRLAAADGPSRQTNSPLLTSRSSVQGEIPPNLMPTPQIWRAGSGFPSPRCSARAAR